MSVIIEDKHLKNLFSWSQFYENSLSLTVSRYPRLQVWEKGKRVYYIPPSDKIKHKKIQEEISRIGNKN